ncbi:hypothetical protein HMPREF1870_02066 [Bacteroidales bacterium KA00344]|nr:hypothetical protein HMPREF1870_02066 [Bacteroidales bacterium KA00344]
MKNEEFLHHIFLFSILFGDYLVAIILGTYSVPKKKMSVEPLSSQ